MRPHRESPGRETEALTDPTPIKSLASIDDHADDRGTIADAVKVPGTRLSWPSILTDAADIVESYDTSVTLRQLFYRLVAAETLPNTVGAYKGLSDKSAKARRDEQ